ncbi:MAG: endonuclease VIII [Gammaproteobacteria bacterium]
MPEGPEIRIEADRIAAVLVERPLEEVWFYPRGLKRYARELVGQQVRAVDTRGKAMLTRFERGLVLYTHNQLYGRWYVRPRGELPQTNRSLRVALHTAESSALLYSASEIQVLPDTELATHPFLARLGPDALDATLDWKDVAERLRSVSFRRRSLSALLLDQGFIAGIGNYLRSEILFFSRVHPALRPMDLDAAAIRTLARNILLITRRAYDTRGVTNPPRRVAALKREGAKRGRYRFAVFARDRRPCYDCATSVIRETLGGRRVYWCPQCQPRP